MKLRMGTGRTTMRGDFNHGNLMVSPAMGDQSKGSHAIGGIAIAAVSRSLLASCGLDDSQKPWVGFDHNQSRFTRLCYPGPRGS
jgi:hypothetical protein